MGPTIIYDKSTFHSLTKEEYRAISIYFTENLTPILGAELLADLRKEGRGSEAAERLVTALADRFGGSGPATNVDYLTLCANCLSGNHFPLDGRIIPQGARSVRSEDGSRGMIVDLSPLNKSILRWTRGDFSQFERNFAEYWQVTTRSIDIDAFARQLSAHHVVFPKVNDLKELGKEVDRLLGLISMQDGWMRWLLEQLSLPRESETAILIRRSRRSTIRLRDFAPYAWHCLQVLLTFVGASRHNLVRRNPTNYLDMQYLFYLPFCMVFVSDDKFHRRLAPLLLRGDQTFVHGEEFRRDLRRIGDFHKSLTDKQKRHLGFALGSYPPPAHGSIIYQLWKRYMKPWRPGMGNRAIELPEQERNDAIDWVTQMIEAAEGVKSKGRSSSTLDYK